VKIPRGVTRVPTDPALFTRVARYCADVGGADLAQSLQGCACYLVEVEGGSVALALRDLGDALEVTAAQGSGAGTVLDYLPWLEAQAAPKRVRLATVRRGLMRELQKRGYAMRAVVLEKESHHGRA
jgi:hypothetical protein